MLSVEFILWLWIFTLIYADLLYADVLNVFIGKAALFT